jgi:ankyrin repeat protein
MVMLLNSKGADLSAGPESPMLAVADYPDPAVAEEMARILLGNGSDPDARRKDGKTALHLAAARGHADVARMLIHRGASVDARGADARTPLDLATGDAVRVLREAAHIDRAYYGARYERDVRGNAVVRDDTNGLPQDFINQFVTFAHFDFEQVKRLYKLCPALLMTRATWDELAIEAAAHMGRIDMAEYLADPGSPVSTCTAVMLGLTDRVKAVVKADPRRMHERGAHDLPLLAYTAFGTERVEIADFLLATGADVNVRAFGQTALHIAAAKGHVELAALLLDRGADVNALTRSRRARATPLAVAQKAQKSQMIDVLVRRGGKAAVLP